MQTTGNLEENTFLSFISNNDVVAQLKTAMLQGSSRVHDEVRSLRETVDKGFSVCVHL